MRQGSELISVILPVRDGDLSLLKTALQSVRRQTYQNVEILLMDDGSGETFSQELDRLAAEDARIRLFQLEGGGVAEARNTAIRRASGEYITFLDGDDELSPVFFEEALTLMREGSFDALWGATRFVSAAQKRYLPQRESVYALSIGQLKDRTVPITADRLHRSRGEIIGEPLRFEDGSYINRGIAARFIRRELFEGGEHLFPPGLRLYEDTIWNLELLPATRIALVKSVWYYYFDNPLSASNRFQRDICTEVEDALTRIRQLLDLEDPTEYAQYTRFLMDSLRYVMRCSSKTPEQGMPHDEYRKLERRLYSAMPWREISSARYLRYASAQDRHKAQLYSMHLLFPVWRVTWKRK